MVWIVSVERNGDKSLKEIVMFVSGKETEFLFLFVRIFSWIFPSFSCSSFVDFNAANTEILDCVVINPQTGLLDYEDCSQKRPFICQSGKKDRGRNWYKGTV